MSRSRAISSEEEANGPFEPRVWCTLLIFEGDQGFCFTVAQFICNDAGCSACNKGKQQERARLPQGTVAIEAKKCFSPKKFLELIPVSLEPQFKINTIMKGSGSMDGGERQT